MAKSTSTTSSKSSSKSPSKPAKKTGASAGFTAEERAAMRERAKEMKANASKAEAEAAMLAKIEEMPAADRAIAERLHAIITSCAPVLAAKTWYGMPAWAKDGDIVCFFQSADKFKARYATFGFNDPANLDDGAMWPTSYAIKELDAAGEKAIRALVEKAVG